MVGRVPVRWVRLRLGKAGFGRSGVVCLDGLWRAKTGCGEVWHGGY